MLHKAGQKLNNLLGIARLDFTDIEIPPLIEVHNYWSAIRGDVIAPSLRNFRLEDLTPSILPYVVLVDFIGPPLDYYYRFFGSKMVEISGIELSGKTYFADKVDGYGFVNAEVFPQLIEEKAPIYTKTRWISVKGITQTTTTARLPFSNDGENITGAVSVNDFSDTSNHHNNEKILHI
jgi:hypothetical protein